MFLQLFPLVAGAVAMWKVVAEVVAGRRHRLREEYRFAREFLDDIKKTPQMHSFLRQKGYQALAGDNRLSAQEVEYLLTLPKSAEALRLYVTGLPYLQHNAMAMGSQVSFKAKYVDSFSRNWRKGMYLILYGAFYALGVAPGFRWPFNLVGLTPSFPLFVTTALFCLPLAVLALRSGLRITAAESLVGKQIRRSLSKQSEVDLAATAVVEHLPQAAPVKQWPHQAPAPSCH